MEDIRRAIDLLTSGDSAFDTVEALETGEIRLTSARGVQLTLRVTGLTVPPEHETDGREGPDLFTSRPDWDEQTLRRRGLPPEWNREWLLRQLYLHGDEASAGLYTGRPEASLRHFRELHGLQNLNQEYARLLWASGLYRTQKELAGKLGVSEARVSSYIGKTGDGKRPDQNAAARSVILSLLSTHGHLSARAFNAEAVQALRDAGDTRNRSKLVTLIKRVRQESAR